MERRHYVVAVVLLALTMSAFGDDGYTVLADDFRVILPSGWRRADDSELKRSQESQELANPELMRRVQAARPAEETLLRLTKYPADHDGLNPLIMITRTRLPEQLRGMSPEKLMEAMLPYITHGFFDVKVADWVPSLKLDGRPAGRMETTYELHEKSGRVTPARAGFVIVIDGDYFYMLGSSAPPEGQDDTRKIFRKVVDSVRFGARKPIR